MKIKISDACILFTVYTYKLQHLPVAVVQTLSLAVLPKVLENSETQPLKPRSMA